MDFGLFWPFFNQKTAKIDKKLRKLAKSKPLMKFSGIWYGDASQQQNATKNFFGFRPILAVFLTKKQPKLTKKETNWQNPNRLIKFSEIWYVDAS